MKAGDKVCYENKENGIVKVVTKNAIMVVYHCNNDWENYANYTSQATHKKSLTEGWKVEEKK